MVKGKFLFCVPSPQQNSPENAFPNHDVILYCRVDLLYEALRCKSEEPVQQRQQTDDQKTADFVFSQFKVAEISQLDEQHEDDNSDGIFGQDFLVAYRNNSKKQLVTLQAFHIAQEPAHVYPRIDLVSQLGMDLKNEVLEFSGGQFFSKNSLVCLAQEAKLYKLEHIRNSTTRYLYLSVFQFPSPETGSAGRLVAKAKLLVDDELMCTVSNFTCKTRLDTSRVSAEFMMVKQRIFAIYRPNSERLPCIYVFALYKNTFMPIKGNHPKCPGLYVLEDRTSTIYANNHRSQERVLYTSRFDGFGENGKTQFTIARLDVKF